MSTLTDRIQIDGSGNAYLITAEGPDYIGSWNPSLRQFTFDDGDVWDVDPTTSIEAFLASFPTDEEVAELESLRDRDEQIDRGYYNPDDMPLVCERCLKPFTFFATTVGGRWVCNTCEGDALADHRADLERAYASLPEAETGDAF